MNPLPFPLKHVCGTTRGQTCIAVHFGLFWFTTECIMNDNNLLYCPKVLVVTGYVSIPHRAKPSWPSGASKLQISLMVCKYMWFPLLCWLNSSRLGRETLPQICFSGKSFTVSPHSIHLLFPKSPSLLPSVPPCFTCSKPATLTLDC